MIINYLKIAFRNFWKQKVYTLINILGLSIGIACFIGIIAYTQNELNYDKHHKDTKSIYRIKLKGSMSGTSFEAAVTGAPVGKILFDELPEIELYTRIIQYPRSILFDYNEKKIYQDGIVYADSSFFNMFSFDLIGNPEKALQQPYSLVMTESIAQLYFGNKNPIGEIIKWDNKTDYTVTAVIKEPIKNTHLAFKVLVSRSSLISDPRYETIYNNMFAFTNQNYVKSYDKNIDELNNKINNVFDAHAGEGMRSSGAELVLELQPIIDIHLRSNITHELEPNGNIVTVYIFIVVAILIILISSINYINLSIANSSVRALEVGIRKTFGANKKSLFIQFIGESLILTLVSFGLGIIILKLFEPIFNIITVKPFDYILKENINWWMVLLIIPLIGILAGSYPSFFLSSLKPIKILKGKAFSGYHKSFFRSSMIVIQFVISIFLISSTWFIFNQLSFIQNKDLGFQKKDILVVSLRNQEMVSQYDLLKNEILQVSGVTGVSASSSYLGSLNQRRGFYRDGFSRKDMLMILNLQCSDNFLEMMNIKIAEGRNFYKDSDADVNKIIVNETLVKEFGIENPIGQSFRLPGNSDNESEDQKLEIIGVCKDFYYASLHEPVKPIIIWKDNSSRRFVSVRVDEQNKKKIVKNISQRWDQIFPEYPFDYFFLEDQYDNLYKADVKFKSVFIVFAVLALFIACLGIFGLTSYATEKRTKEIGIRKVLGADNYKILRLISIDYFSPILISALISIPLSWIFVERWLQNFSFRIGLSWIVFVLSTVFAFLIALLAINTKAFFAARKNPVDSIRYE